MFCHCLRGKFRNVKKELPTLCYYTLFVDKLPENFSRAHYHAILGCCAKTRQKKF